MVIYIGHVFYSEEDKCFIGTCPDLFIGSSSGENFEAAKKELIELFHFVVEGYIEDGEEIPKPTNMISVELENTKENHWFELEKECA